MRYLILVSFHKNKITVMSHTHSIRIYQSTSTNPKNI